MSLISVCALRSVGSRALLSFCSGVCLVKLSLGLVLGTLGMFSSAGNPFLLMIFVSDISLVDAFPSVSGGLPSVQACNLGMIFSTSPALGSGPMSFPVMPDTVVDHFPAIACSVSNFGCARCDLWGRVRS